MSMKFVCWWLTFSQMFSNFKAVRFIHTFFNKLLLATLSCIFAFVGAFVGCITGAVIGQTTETGFLRGCGVGTLSGSLVAVEFAESIVNHNFFTKVGISSGSVDGDFFTDWLTRILLKAYDFQVNNLLYHSLISDLSDIFDLETGAKGLSLEHITNLPTFKVSLRLNQCDENEVFCPICLEEFKEGECAKKLTGCGHEYHRYCIDTWLVRRGSCPVCRHEIVV